MIDYNREKAVAYAHKWAFGRNPRYYNFTGLGGDCANFASQCVYAGAGVMNYKPVLGWYYNSSSDRTPSWSGVKYLYEFLTTNKGAGPRAEETDYSKLEPGDIVQIATWKEEYHHTLVVVKASGNSLDNILIAAHSYDSDNRAVTSYGANKMRCLHITGVMKY
jgi:hypothetical protein